MSNASSLSLEDRHTILQEIEDLVSGDHDASLLFERLEHGFEYSDGSQFFVGDEISHLFIADHLGQIHWITPEARKFLVDLGQKPTLTMRESQAYYPNPRVTKFIPSLNRELLLQRPRQEAAEKWRNHILGLKGTLEPRQAVDAINSSADAFGYSKQQVWTFLFDLLRPDGNDLSICYGLPSSCIRSLLAFTCAPSHKPAEIDILCAAANLNTLHSHAELGIMSADFADIASALHLGEDWLSRADETAYGEALLRIIPHSKNLDQHKKRAEMIRGCTVILQNMGDYSNHKSLKAFAKLNAALEQHDLGGPLSADERNKVIKAVLTVDEIPF